MKLQTWISEYKSNIYFYETPPPLFQRNLQIWSKLFSTAELPLMELLTINKTGKD